MTDPKRDPAPPTSEDDGATRAYHADGEATAVRSSDTSETRAYPVERERTRRADDETTTLLPAEAPARPAVPVQTDTVRTEPRLDRARVLAREREEFGGMRFWTAFFGWLSATGMTVLLIAVVGAVAGLFGAQNLLATGGAQTAGLVSAIVLAVILFIGYFCGGYVAGRMARFSGAKQGLAVWLWAVIMAVLLGIVGAIAGTQANVVGRLGSIPNLPLSPSTLTVAGVVTALVVLAIMLVGALLGGLAGMRYHRRVDRVGLTP